MVKDRARHFSDDAGENLTALCCRNWPLFVVVGVMLDPRVSCDTLIIFFASS